MSSPSRSLNITGPARRDYEEIVSYTAETWGQRQAETYDAAILRALRELRTSPYRGRPRDDVFPGCRSRLIEHHLIYYVVEDTEINILRILHERQDPARHVSR
jgi:toxin ParE1/3/4